MTASLARARDLVSEGRLECVECGQPMTDLEARSWLEREERGAYLPPVCDCCDVAVLMEGHQGHGCPADPLEKQ